ncbi:hypothetical protein FZEAL_8136 [Fusarium zealandicum]|uniref:LysM domain-containing protein n=1 Tax=Fusarium zealandicum TaxID=1053134 RepID=A0A8H4UF32_9HYPO|nr:hypothetical protein FZEAL_8136 [Fusarium zealandicum]
MKLSTFVALFLTHAGLSLADPGAPTLTKRTVSSVTKSNNIKTPLPIQPGMVDNCDKFYLVQKGDICAEIADRFAVALDDFRKWNPSVGYTCAKLRANTNVCVGTIGYVPPTSATCFGGKNIKPWGKNKADALAAVQDWCYHKGAAKWFAIDQKKTACFNAPSGAGKFNFSIANPNSKAKSITGKKCKQLLAISLNGCEQAGQGKEQNWVME